MGAFLTTTPWTCACTGRTGFPDPILDSATLHGWVLFQLQLDRSFVSALTICKGKGKYCDKNVQGDVSQTGFDPVTYGYSPDVPGMGPSRFHCATAIAFLRALQPV